VVAALAEYGPRAESAAPLLLAVAEGKLLAGDPREAEVEPGIMRQMIVSELDIETRLAAIAALPKLGPAGRAAIKPLERMEVWDSNPLIRRAVRRALDPLQQPPAAPLR
jgi:hypothetical protein